MKKASLKGKENEIFLTLAEGCVQYFGWHSIRQFLNKGRAPGTFDPL